MGSPDAYMNLEAGGYGHNSRQTHKITPTTQSFSVAMAAAMRATGTRYGEQLT
jgi:hypothetical protein